MMKRKLSELLFPFLLLAFMISVTMGIENISAQDQQTDSVMDNVNNSDDHTMFAGYLEDTGLNDLLEEEGETFTVLAPTDEAFEGLGDQVEVLEQDEELLQRILVYHLYRGEVPASEAENGLNIEIEDGDKTASNGVVHSLNQVITSQQPPAEPTPPTPPGQGAPPPPPPE